MHPATASITTPSLGSSRASYTVQMVRRKKDDIAGVVKALVVISRAGQGSHWESKACTPAHQASPGLQGSAGGSSLSSLSQGL